MPRVCVDGRSREDGVVEAAPNAAGGSETLVIADALSAAIFLGKGADVASHAEALYAFLADKGFKVGGHRDDHAEGDASGCGANDKLQAILQKIGTAQQEIRSFIGALGVEIDDDTHRNIVARAAALAEGPYVASAGRRMTEVTRTLGGETAIPRLTGAHNEVAVVINTKAGTTLDRAALQKEFGPELQAFNVDVWAIEETIKTVAAKDGRTAAAMYAAALYYNVATALTLAGPSLQIVVR